MTPEDEEFEAIAKRQAKKQAEKSFGDGDCDSPSWCKYYGKCHRKTVRAPMLANCIDTAEKHEPVACVEYIPCCTDQTCPKCKAAIKPELVCVCGAVWEGQELIYTTPQRKPLTDEEIDRLWSQSLADTEGETYLPLREFARAIEAAHGIKEKNT